MGSGSWGPTRLRGIAGPAANILNGQTGRTANPASDEEFGDIELYLQFLIPKGSNSGVYLQGLYEIQVDSYGSRGGRLGVIAQRQPSFQIWFRAPRFDTTGKKIENTRFLRVLRNGLTIQKDVEVDGGTRAHMNLPEATVKPLMLQGDHGPVSYRNL
jgi:hypothetical protein